MKRIKIIIIVVACLLLSNIAGMAMSPLDKKIEKEKTEVVKQLRKSISSIGFTRYMEIGEQERMVVRCLVNEEKRVVLKKIIGFNDDLMKKVGEKVKKKEIITSQTLVGEEIAFRICFVKKEL
ncbi:MAG: hypothetical protein ACEPOZ_04235 [Marinifilaceae bacterium]